MTRRPFRAPAALLAGVLSLAGCASPPTPELASLPGRDFATPERAFEYFREAVRRGETDEAYAWHEFLCFSERLKRERKFAKEEYFFARADVRERLRKELGDFERVKISGPPEAISDDVAALRLVSKDKTARVYFVRENAYEVHFRDGAVEVYGDLPSPRAGLAIADDRLTLSLVVAEALRDRPDLTPDDVYEVRYLSTWKFYDIERSRIGEDIGRILHDAKDAASRPAKGKT